MDLVALAGIFSAVAALLGGVAALGAMISRRRTDRVTAEEAAEERLHDERAAITADYRSLLDTYRQEVTRYEESSRRRDAEHVEAVRVLTVAHDQCQADLAAMAAEVGTRPTRREVDELRAAVGELASRLRDADAKIAELGGT